MKTAEFIIKTYRTLYSFYGPQHWWPGDTPFEVAVGAILTQNTNWTNVEKAIGSLKKEHALSARALYRMPIERVASLIRPAGYYNVKARRLRSFIEFLVDHYQGSMRRMKREETPAIRQKLLSVHGIGEETADSIILYALEKAVFVIDTYTRRILSRHGVIGYHAGYGEYQRLFHEALDEEVEAFNEYHALLVRVGKELCKPRPLCEACPLNAAFFWDLAGSPPGASSNL